MQQVQLQTWISEQASEGLVAGSMHINLLLKMRTIHQEIHQIAAVYPIKNNNSVKLRLFFFTVKGKLELLFLTSIPPK